MFNVIFTSITYDGNLSTVNVPFETEEEANIAIQMFQYASNRSLSRLATRLYKETLQYRIEWNGGVNHVSGYDKNSVVNQFMKDKGITCNEIIEVIQIDKKD